MGFTDNSSLIVPIPHMDRLAMIVCVTHAMHLARTKTFIAELDPVYPNPWTEDGYQGQLMCGVYKVGTSNFPFTVPLK